MPQETSPDTHSIRANSIGQSPTEETPADMGRRWRWRAALAAIASSAVTAALFVLFQAPPEPVVIVVHEPVPMHHAENPSEEGWDAALAEALRVRADLDELKASLETMPPARQLEELARAGERIHLESVAYRSIALPGLAVLHEQAAAAVRGTPGEADAALALSRAYLAAGMRREWIQAFERYTGLLSDRAYQEAREADKSAREIERAEMEARAAAYFDELMRFYEAEDYFSVIDFSDRLVAQFPRTAKAWEGLTVAARAYLASDQPSGSIECYRQIMARCPDERFAREAAKALLKMYLYADQLDNAIEQAGRARRRFRDNDFKAFSYLMEGTALERKGEASHPEAMRAYREAHAAKADSPYADEAGEKIHEMRERLMRELEVDWM